MILLQDASCPFLFESSLAFHLVQHSSSSNSLCMAISGKDTDSNPDSTRFCFLMFRSKIYTLTLFHSSSKLALHPLHLLNRRMGFKERLLDWVVVGSFNLPHQVITSTLRDVFTVLGSNLGFLHPEISAHCLRASGATALLLGQLDMDIFHLIDQ
ncbi:hypothetical protein ACHAW6_010044 [Cyclotella cf. meneghiniana]